MRIEDLTDKMKLLSVLHKQLVKFFDELIGFAPNETDLLLMRLFIKERVCVEDVAKYIVNNLVPLEEKVIAKDEKFFLNNAILFERLHDHESTVNHFKDMWNKNRDEDEREAVWKWLLFFIRLGKQYRLLLTPYN